MMVRQVPGGVLVQVRVRPRSRPGWEVAAGGLVLGVAAAPVGGAATEEARRALAKALGVAPSRVSLHRGERSGTKVFAASGVDAEAARAALSSATGIHPGAGGPGAIA
ncbi:MAG TPA: DUF167 family protein [Actinomycetota bacterium]|nr:DUF167 family protein [Actinomycetota bacterium]